LCSVSVVGRVIVRF